MDLSRRSFFRGAASVAAIPIVVPLAAAIPVPAPAVVWRCGYQAMDLSEIVNTTLRLRSGSLVKSVMENNALLNHLASREGEM